MICIEKSLLAINVFEFPRNMSLKEPVTFCWLLQLQRCSRRLFFCTIADGGTRCHGHAVVQEKTQEPRGWDHVPMWDMGQKPDAHPWETSFHGALPKSAWGEGSLVSQKNRGSEIISLQCLTIFTGKTQGVRRAGQAMHVVSTRGAVPEEADGATRCDGVEVARGSGSPQTTDRRKVAGTSTLFSSSPGYVCCHGPQGDVGTWIGGTKAALKSSDSSSLLGLRTTTEPPCPHPRGCAGDLISAQWSGGGIN